MIWLLAAWLTVTGPDNQEIVLNAEEIVTLRPPRVSEHFAPGAQCLINTEDGKFLTVMETCLEIRNRIENAYNPH